VILGGSTYLALLLFGSDSGPQDELVVLVVALVLGFALYPTVELGLNYLRAPRRMLEEEVVSLKVKVGKLVEKVDGLGSSTAAVVVAPSGPSAEDLLREDLAKITVELESNAILLEEKLARGKIWNSKNRPLDATAYNNGSSRLSRHRPFTSVFQTLSTLYNEMNSFNHIVFLHFSASLNRKETSELSEEECKTMADLAKRAREMREAILEELP